MKLYIFDSVNDRYKIPFNLFVINQNLKVARISSLLIAIACIALRISSLFIDYSFIGAHREYRYGFTFLLISSVLYYIAITYSKRLSLRKGLVLKKLLGTSYPLIIIFSLMWLSFVYGRTPANNMTLFMFGLLFVGVTWLYSIRAVAVTSIIILLAASAGVLYFLQSKELIVMNIIAGCMLISGFYFISRMLYSYHANYFIQLKQIERNNHEITKIGQLKTEMLGIVAHDLRSPLNSISALVELSKNTDTSQNERDQYADLILEACDEARNIIRDLILIVKGESTQGLQLKDVNINLFLSQVQQHWSHQMKDGKQILLTLPENIITAQIDEDKMLRVLDNFIGNAIKFTEEGARIHLQLSAKGKSHTCITVSDNGIGIPDHIQPFLFDRFSKAGRLGLKGEKSHGLGLNICKQIVEQHNGNIQLESKEGEGTSFHITIPLNPSVTISPVNVKEGTTA